MAGHEQLLEMLAHLESYGEILPDKDHKDRDEASFQSDLEHARNLAENLLEDRDAARSELEAFLEGRENGPVVSFPHFDGTAVANCAHVALVEGREGFGELNLFTEGAGHRPILLSFDTPDQCLQALRTIQGGLRRAVGLESILEEMGVAQDPTESVDRSSRYVQWLLTVPRSQVDHVGPVLEELEAAGITVEELE